ncbi:hypothetical protein L2E82_27980 [Cichorium intybus]|uniref:Uncharacterized protein n=1 Tax=Cichorium intybus TaxID=13427 RepID=A0ACB9CUI1_CICIN|nr:hypothetical protein L2E82_27980 [Cichorium intybus]
MNRLHHVQRSGTAGYMDAIYEHTKGVTQKSDVFSFGVVLFEVLFWRKAWPATDDVESFVQRARSHYEEGTLEDMVDTDTREEIDDKSFKIFSETAYSCLKDQRAQRPSMNQIVRQLEKALELQKKFQNYVRSPPGVLVTERSGGESSEVISFDRLKVINVF